MPATPNFCLVFQTLHPHRCSMHFTPITIEHVKVSDLPESWRARLVTENDLRVTVRIEEELSVAEDSGSAFGMWSDRDDLADVAAVTRRLRAPRLAPDK